jgi:hypothetical protein
MFVVKREPKREEFTRKFNAGFANAMDVYNRTLDNSFAETRTWDEAFAETHQANGNILPAGFDRPTKDLGNLLAARVSDFVTPTDMQVSYPIDYSADVFGGFTSLAGNYVPARPLPQIIPAEVDWVGSFREGYQSAT